MSFEPICLYLSCIIIIIITLSSLIPSKDTITSRHREAYRAHCLLYLSEYYPGSICESSCDIIRCVNAGGGHVEVDIEIKQSEKITLMVYITIRINDFESADMYVSSIKDDDILEFKLANLQ